MRTEPRFQFEILISILIAFCVLSSCAAEIPTPEPTRVPSLTPRTSVTPTPTFTPRPTPHQTPPSPGLGDPCDPPCWKGLNPGISTLEDVEWVMTYAITLPVKMELNEKLETYYTYNYRRRRDSIRLGITNDGMLAFINFIADWEEKTLGEMIDLLGAPEAVKIVPGVPRNEEFCSCATIRPGSLIHERDWPRIPGTDDLQETWQPVYHTLLYPKRGLFILIDRFPEEYPCLCYQMPVDEVYGVAIFDMIDQMYQKKREYIYKWPGFGQADPKALDLYFLPEND